MTTKRDNKNEPDFHPIAPAVAADYGRLVSDIAGLLEQARRTAARAVNGILTVTYWEVGRRIVEFEQGGKERAEYGEELLKRLGHDLTVRFGRGFSERNLLKMRVFYMGWEISPTSSAKLEVRAKLPRVEPDTTVRKLAIRPALPSISPTMSAESTARLMVAFPLSWSHYVRLLSVDKPQARAFYESEAIRGGWSVRQLDRQISTQFFERTTHSQRQDLMLIRGRHPKPEDAVPLEDEVRDPYLLEFLNLKDEYSESELEEAIIHHLECFGAHQNRPTSAHLN